MKKFTTLIIGLLMALALASSSSLYAQDGDDEDYDSGVAIFVEGLGPGIYGSINGSFKITNHLAATVGLGYASGQLGPIQFTVITVPIYASYLIGKRSHKLEVLGGVDLAFITGSLFGYTVSGTTTMPMVGAGYRFWPTKGFHFRATAYYFITSNGGQPYFGLSTGASF